LAESDAQVAKANEFNGVVYKEWVCAPVGDGGERGRGIWYAEEMWGLESSWYKNPHGRKKKWVPIR